MSPELEQALWKDFPRLYACRPQIACGDGWEKIIRRLSERLEWLISLTPSEKEAPQATQVKEKFAGLRFYMHLGTDDMHKLIQEAEVQSFKTCESCGEPGSGSSSKYGWAHTYCDACCEKQGAIRWKKDDTTA